MRSLFACVCVCNVPQHNPSATDLLTPQQCKAASVHCVAYKASSQKFINTMMMPILIDQDSFSVAAAAAAAAASALGASPEQAARAVLIALKAMPAACALAGNSPAKFNLAEVDVGRGSMGSDVDGSTSTVAATDFEDAFDHVMCKSIADNAKPLEAPQDEDDGSPRAYSDHGICTRAEDSAEGLDAQSCKSIDARNEKEGKASVHSMSARALVEAYVVAETLAETKKEDLAVEAVAQAEQMETGLLADAAPADAPTEDTRVPKPILRSCVRRPHHDGVDLHELYRDMVFQFGANSTAARALASKVKELERLKDG